MLKKLKNDWACNEVKFPSMFILFFYRLGNHIYYSNVPKILKYIILIPLKLFCKVFIEIPLNSEFPFRANISGGLRIRHPYGIIINGDCIIGENCTIYHQVTIGSNELFQGNTAAEIGDNVYISCGAKIIGKIKIGNRVIIGANAVVIRDIPDNTLAVGVPARLRPISKKP